MPTDCICQQAESGDLSVYSFVISMADFKIVVPSKQAFDYSLIRVDLAGLVRWARMRMHRRCDGWQWKPGAVNPVSVTSAHKLL
jgi:hypothetical protein